ncbi:hypothetical protein, partial [Burkholderia sp. LS-044]|uniref:hypothetical protein n=1 Tax=Burkholderia sp. LS-044 TaxID=1459967 RepID=UPI001B3B87A0
TTDLKGDMVGDRQDGAATAAPSYKKLGKITSTKVGSIYPTLTPWRHRSYGRGSGRRKSGPQAAHKVGAFGRSRIGNVEQPKCGEWFRSHFPK